MDNAEGVMIVDENVMLGQGDPVAKTDNNLMSNDRVVVVIPHYSDDNILDDCLHSLEEYHRGISNKLRLSKAGKLIDASGSGIDKQLSLHGDILVINNNYKNLGFTAACNIGLNGHGYDFIWLLNNDVVVRQNCLNNMLKYMDDPKVGIVGCKILFMDEPDKIHHGGTGQCFPQGIHKVGLVSMGNCNEPSNEKWVTFASVLVRKEMVREIGLMDKRFFNYYSDSDYCYTARSRGWKIVYAPDAVVLHKIGQSQHPNEAQQKVMYADMIKFRDKWLSNKLFFDLDKEIMDKY